MTAKGATVRTKKAYDDVQGVYAFAGIGTFSVKIGWSNNIRRRLGISSMYAPFGLEVIGWISSDDSELEKRIHRDLKKYKLRGEWFLWCDDVRKYIESFFTTTSEGDVRETLVSNEELDKIITDNPLLYCDEQDAAIAPILRAVNDLGVKRHLIAHGLGNWDERLATIEDLAMLASGFNINVTWERHRQLVYRIAEKIASTSRTAATGVSIALELRKYLKSDEYKSRKSVARSIIDVN